MRPANRTSSLRRPARRPSETSHTVPAPNPTTTSGRSPHRPGRNASRGTPIAPATPKTAPAVLRALRRNTQPPTDGARNPLTPSVRSCGQVPVAPVGGDDLRSDVGGGLRRPGRRPPPPHDPHRQQVDVDRAALAGLDGDQPVQSAALLAVGPLGVAPGHVPD